MQDNMASEFQQNEQSISFVLVDDSTPAPLPSSNNQY